MENNQKWSIELNEEQMTIISGALEFVSRFNCGQIGFTYLPHKIQELFYKKDENNKLDWDEVNKRKDLFDTAGSIIKTTLYPELNPTRIGESYGVNKSDYSDNLYDIYKMMNHIMQQEKEINTAPNDVSNNVNSYFTKFGNLDNIKIKKL